MSIAPDDQDRRRHGRGATSPHKNLPSTRKTAAHVVLAPRLLLLTFSLVCVATLHVVPQFFRFRSAQRPFQNLQRAARRIQLEIVALTTYDCNTRRDCPPAVLAREEERRRRVLAARDAVPMIFRFTALDAPQARRWFARQMEVEKWDRLRTRRDLLTVIDYAFRSRLVQGGLGAAREAKVPLMYPEKPVGGTLELALLPPPPSPDPGRERPLKTVSRWTKKMPGGGTEGSRSSCNSDIEDPWAWYENCPNPWPGNMVVDAVFESLAPADARVPIPLVPASTSTPPASTSPAAVATGTTDSTASAAPCAVFSIGIAYHFEFDDHFLQRSPCAVYSFDPSMQRYHNEHENPPKEINYQRGPRHAFSPTALGKADGRHDASKHSTLYGNIKEYDVKTLATFMKERKIETLDVLRIDVEGAEWEMMDQLLDMLPRIRSFSAEFHFPMGVRNIEKMFALLCKSRTISSTSAGRASSGGGASGGGEGGEDAGDGNVPGCFNVATWRYAWCPVEPCLEITAGRVEDVHSSGKGAHG
ncbi:unnamed protein product [Amoebophrya sp. A120]|nr:unnamed protein product [Amoebophrya sp. A120]|eukprot:GSA120T00018582001.1